MPAYPLTATVAMGREQPIEALAGQLSRRLFVAGPKGFSPENSRLSPPQPQQWDAFRWISSEMVIWVEKGQVATPDGWLVWGSTPVISDPVSIDNSARSPCVLSVRAVSRSPEGRWSSGPTDRPNRSAAAYSAKRRPSGQSVCRIHAAFPGSPKATGT